MEEYISKFLLYVAETKKLTSNTLLSLKRDLTKMTTFFKGHGIDDVTKINDIQMNAYLLHLEKNNFSAATISRYISSIKSFFTYLARERIIEREPTYLLKAPKVVKKTPDILSEYEVDRLLTQPDTQTAKGIRDKAMLELLCETGIRVSELVELKMKNVNLQMDYILCSVNGKERIVPLSRSSKQALLEYIGTSRQTLVGGQDLGILFTNCSGSTMSRQGFWKILKTYGSKAGLKGELTSYTLRHAFDAHN